MHKQRKRQRELIQLLREALPKFWCSQWKARVATSSILFALSSQYSQLLIEWLYREMHCGERICTLLLQSCHTNGLLNPKRALTVTEQEDAEDALEAVSKYIRRKTWEKHIIRLSANEGLTLALSHMCAGSILGVAWCSPVAEGWDMLACQSRVGPQEGWKGAAWLAQRPRQCSSSAEKQWAKAEHLLTSLENAAMLMSQPSQIGLSLVPHPLLSATKPFHCLCFS